jgi:serine/threonine protein phosphatase 1
MGQLSSLTLHDASRFAPASSGLTPVTYAVGDIHGRADLLYKLLRKITRDRDALGRPARIVFLGDLVNRGPQSREVIDLLSRGPTDEGDEWIALRGNHDQLMVDALRSGNASDFSCFLSKGGDATLASYGLSRKHMTMSAARAVVPEAHLDFLASLPLLYCSGSYLFVHAGVEPGKALEEQTADVLMNIRKDFLTNDHGLAYTIVHGHTPTDAPVTTPYRIGVDTGACSAGYLTTVVLDHGPPRFIQARGPRARGLKRALSG